MTSVITKADPLLWHSRLGHALSSQMSMVCYSLTSHVIEFTIVLYVL